MFSIEDIVDIVLDIAIIIGVILLLSGCSSTPPVPVTLDTPKYHPEWPLPVQVCDVDWKVLEVEGQPYVAVTYDDNLDLAICTRDLLRYIQDMNAKFCHYRPEEDPNCVTNE